jgi:hypothetical protein
MEVRWETTFFKTQLTDDNDRPIGSFNLNDAKSIIIGDCQINSNGFYDYYVIKGSDKTKIQFHLDPSELTLSLGQENYNLVYESDLYCSLQSGDKIVASCYKDSGLFSSKGSISFLDSVKDKELFAYSILVLRKIAQDRGGEQ